MRHRATLDRGADQSPTTNTLRSLRRKLGTLPRLSGRTPEPSRAHPVDPARTTAVHRSNRPRHRSRRHPQPPPDDVAAMLAAYLGTHHDRQSPRRRAHHSHEAVVARVRPNPRRPEAGRKATLGARRRTHLHRRQTHEHPPPTATSSSCPPRPWRTLIGFGTDSPSTDCPNERSASSNPTASWPKPSDRRSQADLGLARWTRQATWPTSAVTSPTTLPALSNPYTRNRAA